MRCSYHEFRKSLLINAQEDRIISREKELCLIHLFHHFCSQILSLSVNESRFVFEIYAAVQHTVRTQTHSARPEPLRPSLPSPSMLQLNKPKPSQPT